MGDEMTATADNLEIEVKFFIADTENISNRLAELGATRRDRVFETNIRFEDQAHSLKADGKLLRLRRDRACRLTYKCRPDREDTECKVFHELEVTVDDCGTMTAILEALGFHQAQIYEKWRQTYHWQQVEFCLDQMPFGCFLEIEGSRQNIKAASQRLGLAWSERILSNYLAIFHLLRRHYGLPFHDVTFAAFERHPVDIHPLLPLLQAGGKSGLKQEPEG
jgi:adenylate cyclase class 2